jgi:hypothetical protein
MWPAILSFLGGPVIKGLIDAYQAKLKAGNIDSKIAADLAGSEIAAQTLETQSPTQLKMAEIGHPWEPEKFAFYVVLAFFAKCVVWDTILGLGTTPSLKGNVSIRAGLAMPFYFSTRILRRRADHQALTVGTLKR